MNQIEVDGRIVTLEKQRNQALSEVVILSGQLAAAYKEIIDLRNQIKEASNGVNTDAGTT
jgi:hypothetical protein